MAATDGALSGTKKKKRSNRNTVIFRIFTVRIPLRFLPPKRGLNNTAPPAAPWTSA
jgi:hypothetical protein